MIKIEDFMDERLKQLHLSLAKAHLLRNRDSDLSASLKHFNDYLDAYRFSRQLPPFEKVIAYFHCVFDRMQVILDKLETYVVEAT
jgi:hypothetical protein